MLKLDATDRRLLEILQEDSEINVKTLSDELNLTKTPIYDRIRRYEREGLIEKYVAVLNHKKVTNAMVVFASVTLESQRLEGIEQFADSVRDIPEVMECYLLGGANDFLLKVAVSDLDAYHQFSSGKLAALPNVAKVQSTFVLNEVKRSTVFPLGERSS